MKFEFRNACRMLGFIVLVLLSGTASAITFSGTATSFTPGSGYGIDSIADESSPNNATLLDVQFVASGASATFDLPSVGSFVHGVFGQVTFNDAYISPAETDNLDVTADFTFTLPFSGVTHVSANGTAVVGTSFDAAADYTLTWTPLDVSFGDGGLFRIDMDTLTFGTSLTDLTQNQGVTFTLLAMPVPEPEIYAMLGVGLGLMGWATRRRRPV